MREPTRRRRSSASARLMAQVPSVPELPSERCRSRPHLSRGAIDREDAAGEHRALHIAAIDMAFHPAARADQQELLDVDLLRNGAGDVDIGRDDIALDGPRRSDPDRLSGDVALHHAVTMASGTTMATHISDIGRSQPKPIDRHLPHSPRALILLRLTHAFCLRQAYFWRGHDMHSLPKRLFTTDRPSR